ncbi:MAG: alkaline phosphatase family protein [Planctomycetota bacterium]|nr:alkaline phosphatase family protein [Planctomycetota bacterium]
MSNANRVLLIDVPALSCGLVGDGGLSNLNRLKNNGVALAVQPSFPAISATVQASVTTGATPDVHGIVASGFYDRQRMAVCFGDSSDRLLESRRVWEFAKEQSPEFSSALIFWENSLGADCDFIVAPRPIPKRGGGFHSSCYSKPPELNDRLVRKFGPFKQAWLRGPFASMRCSRWITQSTVTLLEDFQPTLVCTSLPHVAFSHIKSGSDERKIKIALLELDECLGDLLDAAEGGDYSVILMASYGMNQVNEAVFPNRYLREHETLITHKVKGMEFLDFGQSRAFVVPEHQVAHVYCNPHAISQVYTLLSTVPGIERILTLEHQTEWQIDHPRSGELILLAAQGYWFAYPWWHDDYQAPEYAFHVDPFMKPGADPLEYFWGAHPFVISQDTSRVTRSHGRLPDDHAGAPVLVTNFTPQTESPEEVKDTEVFRMIMEQLGLETVEPEFRH